MPARRLLRCAAALLLVIALPLRAEPPLRIGNGTEPETLDPQRSQSVAAANVLRDTYEGLTEVGAGGRIQPAAARSWTLSEDGLRYEFELRPNLRWSDGTALLAEHFAAGLRRALDPQTGAYSAQLLLPIAGAQDVIDGKASPSSLGIAALSATRLQITLQQPTAYFPGVLTHPISFPLHPQATAKQLREGGVGNGAYRVVRWTPNAAIELQRNPYYWNHGQTRIAQLIYLPTEDIDAELKRYRAGEIDITSSIPLVQAPKIRARFGNELKLAPYLGAYYYAFNVERPPFKDNPKLRQALALAIDRELIVSRVMNGLALPAYSWVPPGVAGYTPQRFAWAEWPHEKRLALARRLYAEAGYSAQRPLDIELRYNTHDDHKRIATVIAAMWKQHLGARTTLVNEEFKVFLANRRAKKVTQVFRAGWIADYDDATSFLDLMSAQSGNNDTGWAQPRFDALLREAAVTVDVTARAERLAAAERVMLAEMPVIPIYHYLSKHLVKPQLGGWQENSQDVVYSKNLYWRSP